MEEGGSNHKEKNPVGIDVPELLDELGVAKDVTEVVKAFSDCAVIAFYYLLQVGEYTLKKKKQDKTNSAVQVGRYNFFVRMLKGICTNCQ